MRTSIRIYLGRQAEVFTWMTRFFISNTFISNDRLKLAKKQANAKQHPEAELLLFENYSHSSYTLLSKNNRTSLSLFTTFMRLYD